MQAGTFHCGVCGRGTAQQAGRAHHSPSRFMGCWDWLFEGPVDSYDSLNLADVSYVVRHLAGWRSQLPTLVLEHDDVGAMRFPVCVADGRGRRPRPGEMGWRPTVAPGGQSRLCSGGHSVPAAPPKCPPSPAPHRTSKHTDGDPLPLGPFLGIGVGRPGLSGATPTRWGLCPIPSPHTGGASASRPSPRRTHRWANDKDTMRWGHLSSGTGARGWEGGEPAWPAAAPNTPTTAASRPPLPLDARPRPWPWRPWGRGGREAGRRPRGCLPAPTRCQMSIQVCWGPPLGRPNGPGQGWQDLILFCIGVHLCIS